MNRAGSSGIHGTPPEFIAAVVRRWGPLSFDLAASPDNAKAARFYTEADDALVQPWHTLPGLLWLNPPFGNIALWAKKCYTESLLGARIIMLTPASVGANWYRDWCWNQARTIALCGRITFVGSKDPYPKDCMLTVFGGIEGSGFECWTWK